MKYNFNVVRDRNNTNSLKWDISENELPMWVADMDFQTAPAIIEALENKVKEGIFGYSVISEKWNESIVNWWSRRHNFTMKKEWLIFCSGIVPAVTCAVKRITNIGDNVLVQTPVYNIFFNSIENHGRHVLENKLKYDGVQYKIDFEDLEQKLAHPLTTMMILCNPHNPAGRIWSVKELRKIGELCKKHHVVILSDEIHCDLTALGKEYVPFASVSEECKQNSITCLSATKTFNIAGLQTAIVSIPNEEIRNKMKRGLNSDEVAEPNTFAIDAVVAAFTYGEEWLDELREYIEENKKTVAHYLQKELPQIKMVCSDATYLLWLDCTDIIGDTAELCSFIRKETGLYLSSGSQYRGNGNRFMRMNIACPKSILDDGLSRLNQGVRAYEQWVVKQC